MRPHRRPILVDLSAQYMDLGQRSLPVTNETNENLSNNDTQNFKICNGVDPLPVTNRVLFPALWPDTLEEWGKIAYREKNVTVVMSVGSYLAKPVFNN